MERTARRRVLLSRTAVFFKDVKSVRSVIEASQRMAEGSALVGVQDDIFQISGELEIMGAVRFFGIFVHHAAAHIVSV